MRILILEDELTARLLLSKILSDFGRVDTAVNGREAIDLYTKNLNLGYQYDLICLDIMVPEMDGQEVLRRIRQIEVDRGVDGLDDRSKIVMVTALSDSDNFMTAFQEQCEGYIFKPFSKDKIIKTLKLLNLID